MLVGWGGLTVRSGSSTVRMVCLLLASLEIHCTFYVVAHCGVLLDVPCLVDRDMQETRNVRLIVGVNPIAGTISR